MHRSDPRIGLSVGQLQNAADLVEALAAALKPLESLSRTKQPLAAFAQAHQQVVDALSAERRDDGMALAGTDAAALDRAFAEIADNAQDAVTVSAPDYPDLLRAILAEKPVRRPDRPGVRVSHLRIARSASAVGRSRRARQPGRRPMAARNAQRSLAQPPDAPRARPRSSGTTDFAVGARLRADARRPRGGARLSRQAFRRADGTLAFRATAGGGRRQRERWQAALHRGERYLAWARALDRPEAPPRPVARPEPKPARDARPNTLSVTEIETWLRDPYSIYARHVLRLRVLDPVDTPPGARDRGTVIHGAIGQFTSTFKDALPADVVGELVRFGEQAFAVLEDFPEAKAFWWPRYLRIARWFADFERRRRPDVAAISAETSARLDIPLGNRAFTLRTRADRIEHLRDGRYVILDYKTGRPPTLAQVSSGLTPQLTLEGAILRAGAFDGIPAGATIADIVYVALRGGDPAGELRPIRFDDGTPDAKADEALRKLTTLITKFEDESIGYLSKERPMFMRRGGGDYDHLARVKEWSLTGGAAEDAGDAE